MQNKAGILRPALLLKAGKGMDPYSEAMILSLPMETGGLALLKKH
tara:strand:- start:307 stop:441 length:135 start_codon:yes stop_codon:yes gene_type:complete